MAKSLFNSREELERAAKAGDVDALRELGRTPDPKYKELSKITIPKPHSQCAMCHGTKIEKCPAVFHKQRDQAERAIIAWAESCAPEKQNTYAPTDYGNGYDDGFNQCRKEFLDNLRRGNNG